MNVSRFAKLAISAMISAMLGLAAGSVMGQKIASLAFTKVTLFAAMQRLHSETGANVAFVHRSGGSTRTFSLQRGATPTMVGATAKEFGMEDARLASVYVLEEKLPSASTSMGKLKAAADYVNSRLATGARDRNALIGFRAAVQAQARNTSRELGPGTFAFSSLSAKQQQQTLDLLRASMYQMPANSLGCALGLTDEAGHPNP